MPLVLRKRILSVSPQAGCEFNSPLALFGREDRNHATVISVSPEAYAPFTTGNVRSASVFARLRHRHVHRHVLQAVIGRLQLHKGTEADFSIPAADRPGRCTILQVEYL